MRLGALAFLLGILTLHTLPELPDRRWTLALPSLLLILLFLPRLRWPVWGVTGFLWALLLATPPAGLPSVLEGAEITLDGWIASIPDAEGRSLRFTFVVAPVDDPATPTVALAGQRLRLSWWDAEQTDADTGDAAARPALQVGERWRLTVR